MATWGNILTQDANSSLMEQLTFFHDHTVMILSMITIMVAYIMMTLTKNKYINRYLLEGQTIELIWTVMPAITLIFIALPSLRLLYMIDEINNPSITLKVIGHQWYWSYEYSDFSNTEFDSYMKPVNEMNKNEIRLLDVDNRTVIPMNTQARVVVTAADVLHSWAVPALGIKIDAVPGRLNQGTMNINRPGIMYGQCSEICGANHSFMPIVIESTTTENFLKWINSI
ncbi:cytochrome c oxidase subunit II (mitochondrion) [Halyomorpha halys]|uniref:Cytochrome c oxidase subunit 2 n=14 Tax=Halyomorpha halys TaxID=286706 RepID=C8YQC0_HALHY|nr:cytochrome c oxidase subunit II [Halyomorpha halys]ACM79575.1 cytochrome c oxidase subunit II [Halyomorpha halys]BCL51134.1 cytochrome c oxidase subunit II [Halyomorpha halys]